MLNNIALFLLIFVFITIFYGIIAIHDIPYEIAKSRKHPHQDAIHIAGWVSLFTLHVLWPFLWIWATLYRTDRGWGFTTEQNITNRVLSIENQLEQLKKQKNRQNQNKQSSNRNKQPASKPNVNNNKNNITKNKPQKNESDNQGQS